MLKMLLRPWFIGFLIVALGHQIAQKLLHVNFPFADSYLDPILFLPILLHLLLWERRYIWKKGLSYKFTWREIFSVFLIVSIFAEYFFPIWSSSFTRDYWDVLCYAAGAVFFGLFLNS